MKRSRFILLLTLLLPVVGLAQSFNPDKKYPPIQLKEDYDYLVNAFEKAHPGLYWHTDTAIFKEWKDFIGETILRSDSLTETVFLRRAGLLNAVIRCAHTSIDFSEGHDKWWQQNALLLPFNLFTADGKYYVYLNYSESPSIDFGSEILAIDGKPIEEIIETIFPYIPSDGDNTTRKKDVLKTGFYHYYSLAVNESSPTYKIKCVPAHTSDTKTIAVQGISYSALSEKRNLLKKPFVPISLRFVDSLDAGVLRIASFRKDLFEKAGINYETALDSIFAVLKNKSTKNLIIDLRDNGGGLSEFGAQLVANLSQTPFVYCKNQWLTSDTLFDFMSYDIPETFKGFPAGIVKEDGGYKWKKHSVLGLRQPAPNRFSGSIYCIVNGRCASTTAEVVSLVKLYRLGKIVGEEAGGSHKGNTSGITGTVVLPHTGIIATIPLVCYEMPVYPDNLLVKFSVLTDYNITPTIDEWLAGKDPEMDFVLNLITGNK